MLFQIIPQSFLFQWVGESSTGMHCYAALQVKTHLLDAQGKKNFLNLIKIKTQKLLLQTNFFVIRNLYVLRMQRHSTTNTQKNWQINKS